jgi:hypothetical protein
MHPVIALLTAGVEMDVLGLAYDEYSDSERKGPCCKDDRRRWEDGDKLDRHRQVKGALI